MDASRLMTNGEFDVATVAPGDYPVPLSGPTGTMLDQLGRHGYRAAHISISRYMQMGMMNSPL